MLRPPEEPFRSRHYRVTVSGGSEAGGSAFADIDASEVSTRAHADVESRLAEAIIAVEVDGVRRLGAGEGNGPVDALDHAFRNAVNGTWPQLDRVHLSDYKVRILEAEAGTDAVTRVLVTSTDGHAVWDTVGVHANVVEASWFALSDAYTYAIKRVDWAG
jgi:2-isopropylmalate synthase